MTPEELKAAIAELLPGVIGTVLPDIFKSEAFTAAIGGAVRGHVDTAVKGLKISETIAAEVAKVAPKKDETAGAGTGASAGGASGGAGGDADITKSPAFLKLQQQIEQQNNQLKQEQLKREQAEEGARVQRRDAAVRDALGKAGVPADRIPHAMAFIISSGRVKVDDAGVPTMVFQRKGYEEPLPIEAAMKEWVGTDDGKVYVPATTTTGTGTGRGDAGAAAPASFMTGGRLDQGALTRALGAGLGKALGSDRFFGE